MGSYLTKEEQTLSNSLQQQYFFQSNQYLVHKASQRPCTLHRISTYSKQQTISVKRNIGLYNQFKCSSISKLREFFQLDNSGYCSDQQKFYLVFDGHNSPNIKEEYFCRRYAGQGFSDDEIESILSCMLCGLRHYYQTFNRKQSRISLDSVCINRGNNNSLWIKDPWLVQKQNDTNQLPINFLAFYPSPQKIQASNQAYFDYSQFKSDLFSVGIFGLQFLNMNFRDDLYVFKKSVDRQKVNESLRHVINGRLRRGLEILLHQTPEERYKIYQCWDIICTKVYRINNFRFNQTAPSNYQVRNQPFLQNSNARLVNTQPTIRQPFMPNSQVNNQKLQKSQTSNFTTTHYPSPYFQQNVNPYNKPQSIYLPQPSNSIGSHTIPLQHVLYTSQPPPPNLTKQFNRPILMKKANINQNQSSVDMHAFKKRDQKIKFNSQMVPQNNPNQLDNTNKIKILGRPQSQGPTNTSYSPIPCRSYSPSNQLSRSNNTHSPIKFTISNPPRTVLSQNVQQYFQSKCIQTPKFSYQNPHINNIVRDNSQNQNQRVMNSFEYNNKFPSSTLNPKNSLVNSPVTTKSVITISEQASNLLNSNITYPRTTTSHDSSTNVLGKSQDGQRVGSIQLNQVNQKKKGQISPILSSPLNTSKQRNQSVEEVVCISDKFGERNSPLLYRPVEGVQSKIRNVEVVKQNIENDNNPTSPSSVSLTPPRVARNTNKYNSTIVQVNEETPNQSSESEQNVGDIQFLVEEYETGSKYEGFKKNGLRHGRGKFFYQDGGYFDGEWKKNQMHGWGKLFYEGGQLAYQGNWAHDEFHGYGKLYNDNPAALDGKFDYTNFDLLDDYWEFYEGMMANDTKQGRGRIQLTNKEIFEGDFHADRIQGFGKYIRKDDTIIEGIWRDSKLTKVLNSSDIYK